MKKFDKKKLLILVVVIGLLVLAGCQQNVDSEGHTLPERIIYLTTTWSSFFQNEGLFSVLIVYPLAQCINFLSQYMNVALALIVTTVALHLLLLSVSVKSSIDQQRMQMMQPEMEKIQRKYANRTDQNAQMLQAQEMQKLYDKYNINPVLSMIVPFIQLPIIFCMYYAVQRADAVVNGTLFGISLSTTPLQALKMGPAGYLLFGIFVLMGIAQFIATSVPRWMAKSAQKKDYKNQNANGGAMNGQMQMMTYTMLVMILVLGIRWPTAMSLYWLISSIVNVLKTVFIQKRFVENAN